MAKKPEVIKPVLSWEAIKQIAKEYGRSKGALELAKELGVSKQRIAQVAVRLREYGVNIPRIRFSKYRELTKELREESPELFKQ